MQDEARHTVQNHTGFNHNAKLRDRPIVFVSGGLVEPLKELDLETEATMLGAETKPVISDQSAHEAPAANDPDHGAALNPIAGVDFRQASGVDHLQPSVTAPLGDSDIMAPAGPSDQSRPPDSPEPDSDSSEDEIVFKGRRHLHNRIPDSGPIMQDMRKEINAVEAGLETLRVEKPVSPRGSSNVDSDSENDDDAAIDDYIANMLADDVDDAAGETVLNNRDLGGFDDDIQLSTSSNNTSGSGHKKDKSHTTADDGREDKRSGDEAPEYPDSHASDDEAAESIDPDIDDEQLAQLLAKQEELGLGGDELLLFTSDCIIEGTSHQSQKPRGHGLGRQLDKSKGSHRGASAIADAFDDLDLMDWNRPSLQKAKRGKREAPAFDLSDSELEVKLSAAWQKDRLRKKEKKQAREELRAQGLLGKNVNPDSAMVKYPTGMDVENIKTELAAFLLGSDSRFAQRLLSPLDFPVTNLVSAKQSYPPSHGCSRPQNCPRTGPQV